MAEHSELQKPCVKVYVVSKEYQTSNNTGEVLKKGYPNIQSERNLMTLGDDMERWSKMDSSLIGEGTPLETFADSWQWPWNFGIAKVKGLDSQVISETLVMTLGRVQELFSQVGKIKHKEDIW
jgi:hypothetical protein